MSTKKRVFTVLVIDGGGVRGIIPAKVLQELEKKTGKPSCELFDMIAVTSTGSLIGAGLATPSKAESKTPKFSAKEIVGLYKEQVGNIFPDIKFRNLKHLVPGADGYYDVKKFESILKDIYGDTKLGDSLTNLIITAVDVKSNRPVWIQNIHKESDKEGWCGMDLYEAVRASCTAPSLFETKYFYTSPNPDTPDAKERYVFLDGGIFGSTTPRYAYTKAKQVAPPDAEVVVIHLGTLYKNHNISPDEFNKASPLEMLKETLGLMTNMSLKATLEDLRLEIGSKLISIDGAMDEFEPDITLETRLDDASPENMVALEKYADRMIIQNGDKLDKLAEVLKNKVYADQEHTLSKKTLRILAKLLDTQENPKKLNIMYTKIVEYNSDIENDGLNKEDQELCNMVQLLSDCDQAKLERVFVALNEKKKYQNKGSQKFMRGLKTVFMPWSKKKNASNDNKSNDKKNQREQNKKQNKGDPKP